MLEPVLVYYLNHYLGRYVEGLDRDSLRVSVWAGDVVLKDLKLRPEALQGLKLPITVRGGVLGTLRLKVRDVGRRRVACTALAFRTIRAPHSAATARSHVAISLLGHHAALPALAAPAVPLARQQT